ncbi:MAG: hypothetical protein ING66_13455 [Rhodocyclaceae bacterium]|nr:hypothetical protein [Rhodocyclaceae bacterium]MCA3019107.1 hypothetical protein [Rhodocyclaceae bacterium]MCA3025301.1 hypothetical protein [Rhodocyclaceae bacterium]MCA3029587.1 hypothetical protein [Rhodocyclaceae bacterium]MCA3037790.1 hypothetical protein [Rhodocyclaceae bacterium]
MDRERESFDLPVASDTEGEALIVGLDVIRAAGYSHSITPFVRRDGVEQLPTTVGEFRRALVAWDQLANAAEQRYGTSTPSPEAADANPMNATFEV